MKLTELKDIVNKKFDVNISTKTRKRHTVYPKKVYCTLARSLNRYSLEEIGECMNMPHDNVMYHLQTIHRIYDFHKIGCNDIIREHNLDINLIEIKKNKVVEVVDNIELPRYLAEHLAEYSEDDLLELFRTRLKPFKMLLDSRKKQKEIKNIFGAKLITKN
tara:strand:- start:208 stop:690 length:483 start_codon:yes stop_codon:yes gene_type:complete